LSDQTIAVPFDRGLQLLMVAWLVKTPPAWLAFANDLKPAYFDPTLSPIVGVVEVYYKRYKSMPSIEAVSELIRRTYNGGTEEHERTKENLTRTAVEIWETPIKDVAFLEATIRDWLAWRVMTTTIMAAVPNLQQGKYDPELVNNLKAAARISDGTLDIGVEGTDNANVQKVINEIANPDKSKICPTGMVHLDREIGGGHGHGELGIILAPPKGFKSGLLMNFAAAAARRGADRDVAYITLELSEKLQMLRFATRTTMLTKDRLREDPVAYMQAFEERKENIYGGRVFFKFIPPGKCTPNMLRGYLDQLSDSLGKRPGLICIDYLDLMAADKKGEKDYIDKVEVTTEVRSIAIEYDVPVWTACRATREAVNSKTIHMGHMSGAYERVGVADRVLAHMATAAEKSAKRSRLVFVAERNEGGNCIIDCDFRPEVMAISSIGTRPIEDDEEPEEGKGFQKGGRGKRGKQTSEAEDNDRLLKEVCKPQR
jgi:hypothetical protein